MSKIVYLFDSITKEFTNVYTAQESPLEPGVFITPTDSTQIVPPAFNTETSKCIFQNNSWSIVEIPPQPQPTPEELQEQINNEARAYLTSTDWYVIRLTETGTAIPQDILTNRQQARERIV